MIHSADEGAKIPEHAFNLRGQAELEPFVDVPAVRHWPPVVNALVYRSPIGLQAGTGLNVLEEKLGGIPSIHRGLRQGVMSDVPAADLLCHEQGQGTKVRFVHLDGTLQQRLYFRHLEAKHAKPQPDGLLIHVAELLRLPHWHRLGPAPQQAPPRTQGELHARKPGPGE